MPEPNPEGETDLLESVLPGASTVVLDCSNAARDLLPRLNFVADMLAGVREPIESSALLLREQDKSVRVFPIGAGIRFGRSSKCDISVPGFREVSRNHFSITLEDGDYRLTDSSANGTYVRGVPERITTRGLLDGDIIDAAGFTFVFVRV